MEGTKVDKGRAGRGASHVSCSVPHRAESHLEGRTGDWAGWLWRPVQSLDRCQCTSHAQERVPNDELVGESQTSSF